jgi:hypothetical protein
MRTDAGRPDLPEWSYIRPSTKLWPSDDPRLTVDMAFCGA